MHDSPNLRKAKRKEVTFDDELIPKYNHQEYFMELNDDSKILATIYNEYSSIRNHERPRD